MLQAVLKQCSSSAQAVLKHTNFRQGRFMILVRVDPGLRHSLAALSQLNHVNRRRVARRPACL